MFLFVAPCNLVGAVVVVSVSEVKKDLFFAHSEQGSYLS